MSAEFSRWIVYADENLSIARMAVESGYYNAALQNVQQAVEKYLKALLLFRKLPVRKTHSIDLLNSQLNDAGVDVSLEEEDCLLLDSIYMPTKYPFGSALPDFNPDSEICEQCIKIAEKIKSVVSAELNKK